ncbi:DNA binding domain protein, excisionase family [Asticcacaulis excentricus CB 48]|uniref:DNA binding domain protein, excisionase family n=2 Tax=Asticcacaulis excentricus TaxID=78587 RepID=E8RMM2_ASTEC|nr:DNA binding domain protein, excisionase family [Asticcacaulis excentricus CB 48]
MKNKNVGSRMTAIHAEHFTDRMPTDIDRERANQLRQILAELISEDTPVSMKLALEKGQIAEVTLSPLLAQTFLDISRLISSGKGFNITPVDAELTTQQSADMLNVSRPYFVKLLESGKIRFSKIGRHRRIKAEDLFAYKDARDSERAKLLSDMAREDSENGYL